MASSKIGNLTSGDGRRVSQVSTTDLQNIYKSENTRGRDRHKIAIELNKRGASIPELPKKENLNDLSFLK